MSVLRLIPKVRQTETFVVPPSSAVTTAAIFSASIATGRPPRRPLRDRPHPFLGQGSLELCQSAEDME
jgi:hypothetical protein